MTKELKKLITRRYYLKFKTSDMPMGGWAEVNYDKTFFQSHLKRICYVTEKKEWELVIIELRKII